MTSRNLQFGLLAVLLGACGGPQTPKESKTSIQPTDITVVRGAAKTPASTAQAAVEPPGLRLPQGVEPMSYRVDMFIDPAEPAFTGAVDIQIAMNKPADRLWLHARNLRIDSAELSVGDQTHALQSLPSKNEGYLGFDLPEDVSAHQGPLQAYLRITYRGQLGDIRGGGIFRMQVDGRWYVFSHFQPLDARKAFPCFDEPRFKVPWQLTLHVKEGDQAFANTPLASTQKSSKPGYIAHSFAVSKPLPSYLLAVAIGPLDVVDIGRIGRNGTPARIIVPRGQASKTAHARKTIPLLLDWLEDYFDMAYPYAKLDSVAIPNQGGAMEHPGLITYGARILLTDETSKNDDFESFHAMVVAHELAHQWFGNLVTLAWWNDLWLNESFATWMASKLRHRMNPAWESDLHELAQLEWTKQQDSQKFSRSLRRPIANDGDIEGAFDAISYGKGGAVLTMFERWVGEERFRQGVRAYIRKHAWQTSTSDDFLASLGEVADPAITGAFKTFLTQPGIPLITAELSCPKRGKPTLTLAQQRFKEPALSDTGLWSIPVCVRYGRGSRTERECQMLSERRTTTTLKRARSCPRWLVANADGGGYYRVAYQAAMRRELLGRSFGRLNALEQLATISDARGLAETGDIAIDELLGQVPRLARHHNLRVVSAAASLLDAVRTDFVRDELRPVYARFIQKTFGRHARALGWSVRPGEKSAAIDLRRRIVPLVAIAGGDQELRRQARDLAVAWLERKPGSHIDARLQRGLLMAAMRGADDALYARFSSALTDEKDPRRRFPLLMALANTERLDRLQHHWQQIVAGKYDWTYTWAFLQFPLSRRPTQAATYEFIVENYQKLAGTLPAPWRGRFIAVFGALCDDAHYQAVQELATREVAAKPGGKRLMGETLGSIRACIDQRARQQPRLEKFLRSR